MCNLLVKLMFLSAAIQLGIQLSDITSNSRDSKIRIEKASRDVLRIEWKPISLFPREAKRFR